MISKKIPKVITLSNSTALYIIKVTVLTKRKEVWAKKLRENGLKIKYV